MHLSTAIKASIICILSNRTYIVRYSFVTKLTCRLELCQLQLNYQHHKNETHHRIPHRIKLHRVKQHFEKLQIQEKLFKMCYVHL